jgi:hypothetical protein
MISTFLITLSKGLRPRRAAMVRIFGLNDAD